MTAGLIGFAIGLTIGIGFLYWQKQQLQEQEQKLKQLKQESNKKIRDVERENMIFREDTTTLRLEKEELERRLNNLTEDQQAQIEQVEQSYTQQIRQLEQSYRQSQERIQQLEQSALDHSGDGSQLEELKQLTATYEDRIHDLERAYNESNNRSNALENELQSVREDYEERIRVLTVASTQVPPQFLKEAPTIVATGTTVSKEGEIQELVSQPEEIGTETEIYTEEEAQQFTTIQHNNMVYPFVGQETEQLEDPFAELISVEELEPFSDESYPVSNSDDSFPEVITTDELNPFESELEATRESKGLDELLLVEDQTADLNTEKSQKYDSDLLDLIGDDDDLGELMSFDENGQIFPLNNSQTEDDLDLIEMLGEDDSDDDLGGFLELDNSEKEDLELFSDFLDEEDNK